MVSVVVKIMLGLGLGSGLSGGKKSGGMTYLRLSDCNLAPHPDPYNAQSCWADYQALRSPAGLY